MTDRTVLMISGSLRQDSVNSAAVRTAATVCPDGWNSDVYDGVGDLPHFNLDVESAELPPAVRDLRERIDRAGAVLFCIPEYAGTLPGSFKNLLDWTVGGSEIVGKPAAWINVSASITEAAGAHDALRVVLGYTGAAIVDDACVHLPVTRADVGEHGIVETDAFVAGARESLRTLTRGNR